MWMTFKVFIEFVTILLLFYALGFFLLQGMWEFSSWPGIKPAPPVLEGKVLIIGPLGKSLYPSEAHI